MARYGDALLVTGEHMRCQMSELPKDVEYLGKKWELVDDNKKFRFTCDQCGKCCKKVEVMINPYDIARISDYLKINSAEFVNTYCKIHIGDSSKLPVLTLKTDPICNFNKGGLCMIYDARPAICRSFPVGRAQVYDKETKEIKEKWMLNPNCSSIPLRQQKEWTIKEWIEDQKVKECYDGSGEWHKFITELCEKKLVREDDMFRNLFVIVCYMSVGDTKVILGLKEMLEEFGIKECPTFNDAETIKDKVDNAIALARWLFITTKEMEVTE